jgi:hypothetical protein
VQSLSGPLPPHAPLALRVGWIAAFGLLGYAAAALPCWLHGIAAAGPWSALGALAAAAVQAAAGPGARCRRGEMLACMAALSAGLSVDFMLVPPALVMAVCGTGGGLAELLFGAHLRWFPATSLAMLALLVARHGAVSPRGLLRAGIEFGAMLALMSLTMHAFKAMATAGSPWSASGMASAMVVGMSLLFLPYGRLKRLFS